MELILANRLSSVIVNYNTKSPNRRISAGVEEGTMDKATPRFVNAVIGLSMLLMFTVAIVAGQARENFGANVQIAVEATQIPLAGHE